MNNAKMPFVMDYEIGQVIPHEELCKKVRCGCMGGIRYSKDNNVLLVFISEKSNKYNNYWKNGILYYMGMGAGNQSLDYSGNRRLAESLEKNTSIFLIERDTEQRCRLLGRVKLAGDPFYQEITDQKGIRTRAVYFPLCLIP